MRASNGPARGSSYPGAFCPWHADPSPITSSAHGGPGAVMLAPAPSRVQASGGASRSTLTIATSTAALARPSSHNATSRLSGNVAPGAPTSSGTPQPANEPPYGG